MKIIAAHAAWAEGRHDSISRIGAALLNDDDAFRRAGMDVVRSDSREHASVWATRLWERAADYDDDVVLLNDDVATCPDFTSSVEAMLDHAKSDIISLHTTLDVARSLREMGQRFLRMYLVTGPGYVLRRGVAKRLLAFSKRLDFSKLNEDNVLTYFTWHNRQPAWSTIPALVKHDTSVPSTLGYDDHPLRSTCVPWEDGEETSNTGFWEQEGEPAYIECPWMPESALLANEVSMLLGAPMGTCWSCLKAKGELGSPASGLVLCATCAIGYGTGAGQALLTQRARAGLQTAQKQGTLPE